jgi:FkbM family methyltransferase
MPLRAIPPRLCVPILQGPARGLRWRVGAGDHGCWLGSYELDAQRACARILKPGDSACDIGANAGFFSLLMSRLVGPAGMVTAFEPVATNVLELQETLSRNAIRNVTVVGAAVADHTGTSGFNKGDSGYAGRLDSGAADTVSTVALDDAFGSSAATPRLIKVDVEGAAASVVRGAARLLSRSQTTLLLELHGDAELAGVERELATVAYTLVNLQRAPLSREIDWSHFVRALGVPRSTV